MKPAQLEQTLREFHHDKLALRERHVAVARYVTDYAYNNTYQYVIAREDTQLSWLEAALGDLGVVPHAVPAPAVSAPARKAGFTALVEQDAREAGAFVDRWRPRLPAVSNARHRNLLQVVLGETLEHKRFFEQMLGGRRDLLGRRANGAGSVGTGDGVLPQRWLG